MSGDRHARMRQAAEKILNIVHHELKLTPREAIHTLMGMAAVISEEHGDGHAARCEYFDGISRALMNHGNPMGEVSDV